MFGKNKEYNSTSEAIEAFTGVFEKIAEKQAKIIEKDTVAIVEAEIRKKSAEDEHKAAVNAVSNLTILLAGKSED